MKVGTVVDGRSEFVSLPALFPQLRDATGHQYLNPIYADIQPKAPVGRIASECVKPVEQYVGRGADLILVLVDRENRSDCPGVLADVLTNEVRQRSGTAAVDVVVKNRTYENWLVADLDALRDQRARFDVSARVARQVQDNKADNVDGIEVLKRCCSGGYDKVQDSRAIMSRVNVSTVGLHSRSFRRLLRCIQHPCYLTQSRRPAR